MAKILVCDDDKEIVEAIEIYLLQEGYDVLKAYDGEEALKVLKEEKVDLLVIDVMMPRLDGIRATLKIREKNNMPIILSARNYFQSVLYIIIASDNYPCSCLLSLKISLSLANSSNVSASPRILGPFPSFSTASAITSFGYDKRLELFNPFAKVFLL